VPHRGDLMDLCRSLFSPFAPIFFEGLDHKLFKRLMKDYPRGPPGWVCQISGAQGAMFRFDFSLNE
jgi:hypothetical protein